MYDGEKWNFRSVSFINMKNMGKNGSYGFKGVAGQSALSNYPGIRYGATGWKDNDGNLWMFGGLGYGASTYGIAN
jgi:hypothetical protein